MQANKRHINQLFQVTANYLKGFLYNIVLLQDRRLFTPIFYLYSQNTISSAYKLLIQKMSNKLFGERYTNTTKNCIHFLCKNNWSNFSLVGRYVA